MNIEQISKMTTEEFLNTLWYEALASVEDYLEEAAWKRAETLCLRSPEVCRIGIEGFIQGIHAGVYCTFEKGDMSEQWTSYAPTYLADSAVNRIASGNDYLRF